MGLKRNAERPADAGGSQPPLSAVSLQGGGTAVEAPDAVPPTPTQIGMAWGGGWAGGGWADGAWEPQGSLGAPSGGEVGEAEVEVIAATIEEAVELVGAKDDEEEAADAWERERYVAQDEEGDADSHADDNLFGSQPAPSQPIAPTAGDENESPQLVGGSIGSQQQLLQQQPLQQQQTPSAMGGGVRWMVPETPRSESASDSQCVPASQAAVLAVASQDGDSADAAPQVPLYQLQGPPFGGGAFIPETQL